MTSTKENSDNDPIQKFRQYLRDQIEGLQLPKGRPYGHVKIDQNFHVEFYVRENHVSVGFYSIGTVDPDNVIDWIEKQKLRGKTFYKDQALEPLHGKRNASVIRTDFSIPFDSKEDLANSDLRTETVLLFQKIYNTFSGIVENLPEQFSNSRELHDDACDTDPQTQGRKRMNESGTSFAISFDIISPTCIEDLKSDTIAEEGEDLESAAIKVFEGVSDPVSTFRNSLSVEFDGDLDEPDRFKSIRLMGYTGPDRCSPESCSFGKFTLFGIAEISDDYADEEEEDILEDILHAIAINMSTDKYSVDFGEWEEYSISVEDCPHNIVSLTAEWVPEE